MAAYEGLHTPDLYVGFWFKYSNPFSFNLPGSKIYYQYASQQSRTLPNANAYVTIRRGNDGVGIDVDIGIQGHGAFSALKHTVKENVGSIIIQPGRWYWLEIHTKVNTAADVNPPTLESAQANGVLQLWIDDVPMLDYSNLIFIDRPDTWKIARQTPVWGGGGGVINQTQYMWYDHTVLSTTRIGMPGGNPQPTCGDGTCNSGETCSSCANDCAECPMEGKPAPVTDLVAVASSSGSVDLTFSEVDDGLGEPSKYDIRFATPTMQWGSAASVATGTCAIPLLGVQTGQSRTCTVNGLTPDTAYQFQLVSYRGTLDQGATFGVLSNVASATTRDPGDGAGDGGKEASGCNAGARSSGLFGFILLSLSVVSLLVTRKRRRSI